MRVLIADSDSRQALAATRSLAKAGHVVFNAAERSPSLAGSSKYSDGQLRCSSADREPERYVADISALASAHAIDLLLPMTEVSTWLLSAQRELLPGGCLLPFADAERLQMASDKAAMVTLARELAVPVPRTVLCHDAEGALLAISELPFPVVLKPSRSRVRTAEGWVSNRVAYATDEAELRARLAQLQSASFPLLLQERIRGHGIGFFACYDRGRLVATFAHRRLREKPATGGVSVLSESIPVPPRALDLGRRLLERLDWHGVAMVEFKEDERDGSLRLMEINARFWGSLQLAIHAGVDFPVILAGMAGGTPPANPPEYRSGARSRWLIGDVDSLIGSMRGPSRWRSLREFFAGGGRDVDYDVISLDDPAPGLLEFRRWLTQN